MDRRTPEPLFDAEFQTLQRARLARRGGAKPVLYAKTEALLKERLEGLKAPPPDLVLSCLELQSENDLPKILQEIYAALKPGGLFLAALAGGDTLCEMRLCLMEAEIAHKGGASPRVHPMPDLLALSRLMQETGFAAPVADIDRITLIYPDLFALMRALRGLGQTNSLSARSRAFAPRALLTKAAALYAARFPAPSGGITASIDLLFLHGWKE